MQEIDTIYFLVSTIISEAGHCTHATGICDPRQDIATDDICDFVG